MSDLSEKMLILSRQPLDAISSGDGFVVSVVVPILCVIAMIMVVTLLLRPRLSLTLGLEPQQVVSMGVGAYIFNAIGYWFLTDFPIAAYLYKISPDLQILAAKGFYYTSVLWPMSLVR